MRHPFPVSLIQAATFFSGMSGLLFCYGSLKQGFPRHWILQKSIWNGETNFLGSFKTHQPYPLRLRQPHGVPAMMYHPGQYIIECQEWSNRKKKINFPAYMSVYVLSFAILRFFFNIAINHVVSHHVFLQGKDTKWKVSCIV